MAGKFRIHTLSNLSIAITVVLAIVCIALSFFGFEKYVILNNTAQDYMNSEAAAHMFQGGSDNLTKQVRLAAATGEQKYIDAYFEEANVTKSREKAMDNLMALHGDPQAMVPLQNALAASVKLMQTEYYSMRLVEEAIHADFDLWPQEIHSVVLSSEDAALSDEEKMEKAETMLIDVNYENAKDEISDNVSEALEVLTDEIMERQTRAAEVFTEIYSIIIICIIIFAVLMILDCIILRRGVVRPLLEYNENIQHGLISPIHGVRELQTLAGTYNSIYKENHEREMLMKHEAEHDPLTELLNRRSFDQILRLYEKDESSFALIMLDIDNFKPVNDTYGHAIGDQILKRVALLLKTAFRSIDYVCRIGGDEFAIVMVDMTYDLYYTITDKIQEVNRQLAIPEEGLPAVSVSAGVAFSKRENREKSLFEEADTALYYTKGHGRSGCNLYPTPENSDDE